MSNSFFLILFTCLLYGIIRYFSYITKDRESHEDGGRLNSLFIGRLLFWLGGIILIFFIIDIFRIQMAANPGYGFIGAGLILLTIIILIIIEIVINKQKKSQK
ncbi:hypothetical protein [Streptococcus moroccensis]|uniref:Cell division protein FtsW (Lipid II flippase) n=1 Tax=Streptococcus moroccensis TaxID=1451356 RepID=A0ABT9YP62_9STRE|nr:hypothetical protein [Streptococcus moroccensis]MDQ0221774.1 cell division protein FtsW (lipid II flippase) [Streptococcus moroccensis]